ncbi:MAG: PQQ-binding-like beta-propeller repeat protein [Candidatus Brocadiia bacterium]
MSAPSVPRALAAALVAFAAPALGGDWPTLRGNNQRTAYVHAALEEPFHVAWARYFQGERLGSAVEPIVAEGKVFAGTHSGNLYALDARTGEPLWRVEAHAPFLHSPAYANGIVVAGTTAGPLYGVDAARGEVLWSLTHGRGGFSGSPMIEEGTVYAATRLGTVFAADLRTGATSWVRHLEVPFRQSPAFADGRLFLTGEDLRTRCFDARTSRLYWTSRPLMGQTARDYYPVVAETPAATAVVVRTNPVLQMSRLIGLDRGLLCRAAGLEDPGWKDVAAWAESEKSDGTAEQLAEEQEAILRHLAEHPEARTFYILDPLTGLELERAPVLWCAGCQGVGIPPNVLPDGRLFVFHRTAYGHWSHGVAPLVGLGLYELKANRIALLRHAHGTAVPWGVFWGTADESQNFLIARRTALLVHQGTLSGYDFDSGRIFAIAGKRDTWGGFHNLPWARNEWHGPARGGVAVAGGRIYWQTGSRILCIVAGQRGEGAADAAVRGADVPTRSAEPVAPPSREALRRRLRELADQVLAERWAPLYVQPGLAGREFFFDHSGELFEALAWAFPHLSPEQQEKAKALLGEQWERHPPYTAQAWYPLDEGRRRERFAVPEELLRRGRGPRHHPFANLYAVWLYARRCGEWERVLAAWKGIRAAAQDFLDSRWKLDPEKGHLFANRILASLLAFARMAEKVPDPAAAAAANPTLERTTEAYVAWWKASGQAAELPVFENIRQWDGFIHKGGALFHKVSGHRAKVALFRDLSPEVAALARARAPEAIDAVWQAFDALCATWYLAGEERQAHYGENFVDPPDFALGAFKALAWLRGAEPQALARRVDIPFCKADLAYLAKLAIALER